MALLKDYFGRFKWDSPILYTITAEMVQDLVEANLGRKLSNVEIERMHYAMIENEEAYDRFTDFILTSAKDAMNNEDGSWDDIDKKFHNRPVLEEINGYQIGSDTQ